MVSGNIIQYDYRTEEVKRKNSKYILSFHFPLEIIFLLRELAHRGFMYNSTLSSGWKKNQEKKWKCLIVVRMEKNYF